jgi:EF hand domain-containing protein
MIHGPKIGHAMTLAAAIAVVISAPAFAGGHPDHAKLDTNGDGKIDLAEAQAARPDFTIEKFNAADMNHDGHLSQDEWPGRGHSWGVLDADKDGNYTLEELRAKHPDMTQQQYSTYDSNKDGKVTRDELKATMEKPAAPSGN